VSKPDFKSWLNGDKTTDKPTENPPDTGDSYEEPTGDGRSSRHQVFGLEVEDSDRNFWFFPYGAFLPCKLGAVNGGRFVFKIAGDDCTFEMEIEGPISAVRYAIDKLCSGKRELLRPNDASITRITVREVPFKKAGKE